MSDEEKGQEAPGWLLTYGDMVTLLVTFFVMLISLSTINVDKYKKTMSKVQETFSRGGEHILEGGKRPVETFMKKDTSESENLESRELMTIDLNRELVSRIDNYETEEQRAEPNENLVDPEAAYHYLLTRIKEGAIAKYIDIEDIKIGCKIKIPKNLCFEEDDSLLKRESYIIFKELGTILRVMRGKIVIDTSFGKIIKPTITEENDISIDRAVNIFNFFVNKENLEPQRIAIAGYNKSSMVDDEGSIGILILKK